MKLLFFFFSGLFIFFNAESRLIAEKNVPAIIQKAFHSQFTHVKEVQWRQDEDSVYAVDFVSKSQEVSAYFSLKGELIEYAVMKDLATFDSKLLEQIKIHCPEGAIEDIIEVNHSGDQKFYVVNVLEGKKTVEHFFDMEGNLTHKFHLK